jgi:hypothetical protein
MKQSNALLVGDRLNKRVLRCNNVSVLKFVTCILDPGNIAVLANVQPQSFATESHKNRVHEIFSLFPNNEFSASNNR